MFNSRGRGRKPYADRGQNTKRMADLHCVLLRPLQKQEERQQQLRSNISRSIDQRHVHHFAYNYEPHSQFSKPASKSQASLHGEETPHCAVRDMIGWLRLPETEFP